MIDIEWHWLFVAALAELRAILHLICNFTEHTSLQSHADNIIGPEGAAALCITLPHLTLLKGLDLSSTIRIPELLSFFSSQHDF